MADILIFMADSVVYSGRGIYHNIQMVRVIVFA